MGLFSRKVKDKFDINKTKAYYESTRKHNRNNFSVCPDWLEPEYDHLGNFKEEPDGLFALFDPLFQSRIFREGKVAIGALVQANVQLFEKGDINCPANYIYSTDPFYIENPEALAYLAHALFDTKGGRGYHPSIQRLADLLADELESIFCYKLPRDLTEGRDVYFTSVVVDRNHLPHGKIIDQLIPMLILPEEEPDAVILPYWYWKA